MTTFIKNCDNSYAELLFVLGLCHLVSMGSTGCRPCLASPAAYRAGLRGHCRLQSCAPALHGCTTLHVYYY